MVLRVFVTFEALLVCRKRTERVYGRLQCPSGLLVISGDDMRDAMPFYNNMRKVNEVPMHTSHRNAAVASRACRASIRFSHNLIHASKATPSLVLHHCRTQIRADKLLLHGLPLSVSVTVKFCRSRRCLNCSPLLVVTRQVIGLTRLNGVHKPSSAE